MKELAMGLEASGKAFIRLQGHPQSSMQQRTLELNGYPMDSKIKSDEIIREFWYTNGLHGRKFWLINQ